jgi:hypothetical protein
LQDSIHFLAWFKTEQQILGVNVVVNLVELLSDKVCDEAYDEDPDKICYPKWAVSEPCPFPETDRDGRSGPRSCLAFTSTFPLHLSSPGMRLLLERPHKEALGLLMESKRRRGWERPTKHVPPTPAACLREARGLLRHDCLFQMNWVPKRPVGAAIPVKPPDGAGEPPVALALSGPGRDISTETVLLWLQEGRRAVEVALRS